jgi:hypothetical protein
MPNEHFLNKSLNILKASLPFMSGNSQRFISYYIKVEEINILCNSLNDEFENDLKTCENCTSGNLCELVAAIKPYLNNTESELVDMFLNMINALNMYTTYKSFPDLYNFYSDENQEITHDDNDIKHTSNNLNNNKSMSSTINIDMLKNMLSPSQRAMFDTYSSMLNNNQNIL